MFVISALLLILLCFQCSKLLCTDVLLFMFCLQFMRVWSWTTKHNER